MKQYIGKYSRNNYISIAATPQTLDQYYNENYETIDLDPKPTDPSEWDDWYEQIIDHISINEGAEHSFETSQGGTIHVDRNYDDLEFISFGKEE